MLKKYYPMIKLDNSKIKRELTTRLILTQ